MGTKAKKFLNMHYIHTNKMLFLKLDTDGAKSKLITIIEINNYSIKWKIYFTRMTVCSLIINGSKEFLFAFYVT